MDKCHTSSEEARERKGGEGREGERREWVGRGEGGARVGEGKEERRTKQW